MTKGSPGALRRAGRHLRAAWRLGALFACFAALTPLVVAGRAGLLGRRRRTLFWRVGCQRRMARLIFDLIGFRIEVSGDPGRGPKIIVSNHISYMDIALLASCLNTSFVGMKEIEGWPLIGSFGVACGSIFIDRSRVGDVLRAGRQMTRVLEQGAHFVIFPEGGAGNGESVRDFHAAIIAPVARNKMPVCAAAIGYSTPSGELPAGRAVGWWEKISLLHHAWRMLCVPPYTARVRFRETVHRIEDTGELTARLQREVAELGPRGGRWFRSQTKASAIMGWGARRAREVYPSQSSIARSAASRASAGTPRKERSLAFQSTR